VESFPRENFCSGFEIGKDDSDSQFFFQLIRLHE